jgi:putative endonuclease
VNTKSARHIDAEKRGRWAERICVVMLRLTGWRIAARQMKAARGTGLGEIDIVAVRGSTIAFIEVKARGSANDAAESVTLAQRARITRSAEVYLQRRPELASYNVRFDVMVLDRGLLPHRIVDAWRP